MLPLTPAARLALTDALDAHVALQSRLHESLRRFRNPNRPQDDEVPFLDGSTLDDAMENLDEPLFNGFGDSQWAVRSVAIDALATLVDTSKDDFHQGFLAQALQTLLDHKKQGTQVAGVPSFAFSALKRGGGQSGLGGGGRKAQVVGASPIAPTPYVSPAFEVRVSVLHALRVIGQTSDTCRDTSLLLLLLAHGPDASRAIQAAAPIKKPHADDDEEPPPPRAPLRCAAEAAVRSIALAANEPTDALLRRRGQQLLALWLQFDPRAPKAAVHAVWRGRSLNPDDALKSFVGMNRIPLATAAAMASNAEVMSTAATALGLAGSTAELLLEALPHVLARLLSMHGSLVDAEREAYTRGIDFVTRQLAQKDLIKSAEPKIPELITSLLLCATTNEPPHPPKRSIAHLRSVLTAVPGSVGSSAAVVAKDPLAQTLRHLPALRVLLLVLQLREAVATGEAELAAFELLLDEKMLAAEQIGEGCTPHLLQAALLPAASNGGNGRDEATHSHTRAVCLRSFIIGLVGWRACAPRCCRRCFGRCYRSRRARNPLSAFFRRYLRDRLAVMTTWAMPSCPQQSPRPLKPWRLI